MVKRVGYYMYVYFVQVRDYIETTVSRGRHLTLHKWNY
jgi:hypothetical protein